MTSRRLGKTNQDIIDKIVVAVWPKDFEDGWPDIPKIMRHVAAVRDLEHHGITTGLTKAEVKHISSLLKGESI